MSFITKKAIPRRTVLRGMGVTLALPLLDAMVPALSAFGQTAAAVTPRFGVVFAPNGMNMRDWMPKTTGRAYELTPILEPLAAFRDRFAVLSGLYCKLPDPGVATGVHARASTRFLTDAHPKAAQGSEIHADVSLDQIVAQHLGKDNAFDSLQLALESSETSGSCDLGFSCAYTTTISWRTATTPLPTENNPRAVFDRLFGDAGSDPAARESRSRRDRSLLDSVTAKVASLNTRLGSDDQRKLTEYLDAIRDVERRIQNAERQTRDLPAIAQPVGIPTSIEEHAKLMFDLLVLAYRSNLTRVFTMMMARELSGRSYPEIGVPDGHHPISHHQNDPERLAKLTKINAFHTRMFAYFLDKLKTTPDGDGSLLDHVILIYGAGMSDSNSHSPDNLPILLLGAGGEGQHISFSKKDAPLANLHVGLLAKMGLDVERMGDSTGALTVG